MCAKAIMGTPLLELLGSGDSLIHIGAHFAEERDAYQKKGISVMWVEACPLFEGAIKKNLQDKSDQIYRICALSDTSGKKKIFNISNNREGVSSSFYDFGKDVDILWPKTNLCHVNSVSVKTKTLDNLIDEESYWISTKQPRALLIDVQGAELDVLRGSVGSLWRFDIIQIETSAVNVYENGNTRDPVIKLLSQNGFELKEIIEQVPGHGDLIFERLQSKISSSEFASRGYQDINRKRIEHLATLGISFDRKTVLELGSGPGDLSEYFLSEGAYVTSIDGRAENICAAHDKFKDNYRWTGFVYDLEKQIAPIDVKYDIVIAYGILYHLGNPKKFLRRIKDLNPDLFLLSTCVTSEFSIDIKSSKFNLIEESISNGTQALNGVGCRPNRKWLWEKLSQFFNFTYACRWQPNHDQFPKDWSIVKPNKSSLTRMIYVCSSRKIDSPWSLDQLPKVQDVKYFSAKEYGASATQVIESQKFLAYPRIVSIETLVLCNARCSFCAYPDSERKGEKLSSELFYKIIDDLSVNGNSPMAMTLARINEPLLDKRLQEFSEHILSTFPKTNYSIWSNGTQLTPKNVNWISELQGNISLQVSLNSINEKEHDLFMGIGLKDILKNLDYVHNHTSIKCALHAPFISSEQKEVFTKYCERRWPNFQSSLRPIFNWTGNHPNGISTSAKHLKLRENYEENYKDMAILSQPCNQWNDLHILASGQVTKCCIDEAGYQEKDFSVEHNNVLDIYAKTLHLRQELTSRSSVRGCENCTHPG